ncbi:hypothetical protein AALM99_07010 [Lactococcus muris]|uniref:Uncharacterized protein n=1 Tax=Lactococcus muris TaxID=2941330 RepID=A0ABV4D8V9_9LACT
MAAPEEETLYLDFDKFYGYLLTEVLRRIKERPDDKEKYLKLLGGRKNALKL